MSDKQIRTATMPVPWVVGHTDSDGFTEIQTPSLDGDGDYIALAYTKADADFIVRACNSHDDLVAALDDIIKYVSPGDDVPFAAMIEEAKAALAKAQP